jgi:hypothetical protein
MKAYSGPPVKVAELKANLRHQRNPPCLMKGKSHKPGQCRRMKDHKLPQPPMGKRK